MIKQRFVFIAKSLSGGGAEKVLLETASLLQRRGHAVLVLTLSGTVEHLLPDNVTVQNLNVLGKVAKALGRNTWVNRWQAKQVNAVIDVFQADVVISCNAEYVSRFVPHPNLYHWVHGVITGSKPRVLQDLCRLYENARLICVAQAIADDIKALGIRPLRCEVIYNPFDTQKIQHLAQAYQPQIPPPFLLHVGSFNPRKRHDRLLRAYQQSGVNMPLVLMGQGAHQAEIEQQIKQLGLSNQVILHPFEANPYPYIQAACALLLSSDQEGLPTVLIEALICHTPIVSVDCPSGPAEILTGDLQEFLVPVQDESALAQAIVKVVNTKPMIELKHYERFAVESVLPKFETLA
ncbi:group 1 glycosyl transferase [Vitreoscilla sp. C1]|uniref:glycosyltransferase n=1 Tax=Vitreoscilla sp. (strain C1) TaxID=96942 RepID=UPI000CDBB84D|nr:glycosyltransferase [Vitreoscilla sp. C1]AUZ06092.1 group 1 glycosyl transferase [Vitreoscilla sp. C1]